VRILLDAHVSHRHVGRHLARAGHAVLALDQDEILSRLADEEVLALAGDQRRIVITRSVHHFAPIARSWAETGRSHGGLILVTRLHADYGAILRRLERVFSARPDQDAWIDRVEFLGGE